MTATMICRDCGAPKCLDEFSRSSRTANGRRQPCLQCMREQIGESRQRPVEWTCTKCSCTKALRLFPRHPGTTSGHRQPCIECCRTSGRDRAHRQRTAGQWHP